MRKIYIEYLDQSLASIDMNRIPSALIRAVDDARNRYPDVLNEWPKMRFDELFEKMYNCRMEYNNFTGISVITWMKDSDYTAFLLKWA